MAAQTASSPTVLRRNQLEKKLGLSRSTIYGRINPKSPSYDPEFPKPIKLGGCQSNSAVGWLLEEVDTYLAAQIKKSREA